MESPAMSLSLLATLPHARTSGLSVPPSNLTTGPVVAVVNSILSAATNVFTVTNPRSEAYYAGGRSGRHNYHQWLWFSAECLSADSGSVQWNFFYAKSTSGRAP